ncbi:MAG: hypothetical protein ACKV2Q_18950 [Planctomycetaceae bacterium]
MSTDAMDSQNDELQFQNIRFRMDGVGEWDQTRFALYLNRNLIRRITLCNGFQCERPILAGLLGLVVSAVGLAGVAIFFGALGAGFVVSKYVMALPVCLLVGCWMIFTAMKRGFYLDVILESDRRKLCFQGSVDVASLDQFLREVESQLGYQIERVLPSGSR